jgi:outer membrane protein OmpA-like peptidoglycan-associated protein
MLMKKLLTPKLILLVAILIGLSGCTMKKRPTASMSIVADKASSINNSDLEKKLSKQGIKTTAIGDYVIFAVPSNRLFVPGTPHIKTSAYPVLGALIQAINSQEKITVKVSAYTDNTGQPERDLALTNQQASALVYYLRRHGLDTRVLYPKGYGSQHAKTKKAYSLSQVAERHIEFSMMRMPVPESIEG